MLKLVRWRDKLQHRNKTYIITNHHGLSLYFQNQLPKVINPTNRNIPKDSLELSGKASKFSKPRFTISSYPGVKLAPMESQTLLLGPHLSGYED